MTHTQPWKAVAALGAAALVLTLSACSGGGGTKPGEPEPSETPEPGPLDAYFSQMYGDQSQEDANAQQMRSEEIIAECMNEQGFEYTPVDYSSMQGGPVDMVEPEVQWGTKEFAAQYGYGATTDPYGNQEEQEPPPDEEPFVDPNQDYVMAMSETEQQAYYIALYGEQSQEQTDPEAEIEWSWEDAGCQGRAQHEVYEGGNGMDDGAFEELQEEMTAMYDASMADPRIAELNAGWASCMADKGIEGMAAVGDGETRIYDQVNALWEDQTSGGEEWTEEDWQAQQDEIEKKMAAITPEEIKTAVADFDCREKVGYDKVQREVNLEYQQDFVDAHKAELDAWLAATKTADGKAKG